MNENENKNEQIIEETENTEKKQKSALREMLDWIICILIAILVATILKNHILFVAAVDGSSMENTLHDKERLITWKLFYEPKQGDVIIFQPKKSINDGIDYYYVKRVIATEGQSVEIDYENDVVYVDGEALDEPYIRDKDMLVRGTETQWTVPEGCVFVLGDNRNNSTDSRIYDAVGFVDKDTISGKAVLRFWPLNKLSVVK